MLELATPLLGFVVGVMIGISGMGGGSLMTPSMILLLGIRPVTALGTDLVYMALTKTFGALQYYRRATLDLQIVKYLLLGGIPSAAFGIVLVSEVVFSVGLPIDSFINQSLGLVLIPAAILILYQATGRLEEISGRFSNTSRIKRNIITVMMGSVVGFLVSITSVGSGTLLLPFLLFSYNLIPTRLIGTDMLFAAAITGIAGFSYLIFGGVELTLLALLMTGSIPGVYIGSRIGHNLPIRYIRIILGVILFITAISLLVKG
ncbi:MAG: sulfite exporter TauE/SafE family protein [Nitrososphaerales archaeon]